MGHDTTGFRVVCSPRCVACMRSGLGLSRESQHVRD